MRVFGALSALTFRVRAGRQTLFLGHVQFPATACHRSALVSVPRRPRTASPGKSKMVSSSCCPVSSHPHSTLPFPSGYRHQKAPRQEGQPYRAEERGSLPALARQGMLPVHLGRRMSDLAIASSTVSLPGARTPLSTRFLLCLESRMKETT